MLNGTVILAVSFAASLLATLGLIPLLRKHGVLDVPNARSSHIAPTPRGGGLGIIIGLSAGFLIAALMGSPLPRVELLVAAALIALMGLIDDRRGLSVQIRFAFQIVAAAVVVARTGGLMRLPLPSPLDISLEFLAVPVALVWIVAVTNLFNFLDGIDGFAGVQGVVAGIGIALLGPGTAFVPAGLAVAGACLGFLIFNWSPAKVFMGDVGSGGLGFLLAALPFELLPAERGKAVFAFSMCLWFFLSDGLFTIARRLAQGEKVWTAHRSHLYQRLTGTGLRHDQVTVRVMGAASVVTLLAAVSARSGVSFSDWLVLAVALITFFEYYRWTSQREKKFS